MTTAIQVAGEVLSNLEIIPGPSDQDRADAARYHREITRWVAKWFDVGQMLLEIKQRNLYRCLKGPDGKPFLSFRQYTDSIHNFGVRRANQLILEAQKFKVIEEKAPEQAAKLTSPSHVAAIPNSLPVPEAIKVLEESGPNPAPKTIGDAAKARTKETAKTPQAMDRLVKILQRLELMLTEDLAWESSDATALQTIINVAESLKGKCK